MGKFSLAVQERIAIQMYMTIVTGSVESRRISNTMGGLAKFLMVFIVCF